MWMEWLLWFAEVNLCGQNSGCNGCDGLLKLTCVHRIVDVMVVMVC